MGGVAHRGAGLGLIVAVFGYYWDVSWHIDRGRDPGAFANPAHWFIIVGLDAIAFAGILALILGDDRDRASVRIGKDWYAPVGAVLLMLCGVLALAGFPLDDIWHRLFGQDVTAWGTHPHPDDRRRLAGHAGHLGPQRAGRPRQPS